MGALLPDRGWPCSGLVVQSVRLWARTVAHEDSSRGDGLAKVVVVAVDAASRCRTGFGLNIEHSQYFSTRDKLK